ncbi:hypothetical protein QQF64_035463 [Cirrhinus molitorella]|uniref:Uncharacterized protein n=1 Tax=Cirrhinus molitorella TaxID=172907 RepID=A0ABR3NFW8_9TELE
MHRIFTITRSRCSCAEREDDGPPDGPVAWRRGLNHQPLCPCALGHRTHAVLRALFLPLSLSSLSMCVCRCTDSRAAQHQCFSLSVPIWQSSVTRGESCSGWAWSHGYRTLLL